MRAERPIPRCQHARVPRAKAGAPCPDCGSSRAQFCPFCLVETDTAPSPAYRFVCTVCGHARVPLDDPAVVRSFAEKSAIERAHRARRLRILWQLLGATCAGFGLLTLVMAALVTALFGKSLFILGSAASFVALTIGLFFVFRGRARRSERLFHDALESAWLEVASEHAKVHRTADPAALAEAMHIDDELAITLTAKLDVSELLLSRLPHDPRWQDLEGPPIRVHTDETELSDPGMVDAPHGLRAKRSKS